MTRRLRQIYTRRGDDGQTGIVGGERVSKDSIMIASCGTVDELNAHLGLARCMMAEAPAVDRRWQEELQQCQRELMRLTPLLATPAEHERHAELLGRLSGDGADSLDAAVDRMEAQIESCLAEVPAVDGFVMPGSDCVNAQLHVSRSVCRRLERVLVRRRREGLAVPPPVLQYVNRLSDLLFAVSRRVALEQGRDEVCG